MVLLLLVQSMLFLLQFLLVLRYCECMFLAAVEREKELTIVAAEVMYSFISLVLILKYFLVDIIEFLHVNIYSHCSLQYIININLSMLFCF